MIEEIISPIFIQTVAIIGAVIGFTEWRYRVVHNCLSRLETRLDLHMDKNKNG